VDANGTVVTITRRSARASDKIYLKQEMFIKEIKLQLKLVTSGKIRKRETHGFMFHFLR